MFVRFTHHARQSLSLSKLPILGSWDDWDEKFGKCVQEDTMKAFLQHHIGGQIFVFFTGLAALLHSTWSVGTLFSGVQPEPTIDLKNRFPEAVQFLGWIVPSFLIALSLDIGQINTASQIKDGQRHWTKLLTFGVFAVATYYLQWFYLTEHTPTLIASQGIREEWRWTVQLFRDWSLWLIPLLLPLSTIMYTFSDRKPVESAPASIPVVTPQVTVTEPGQPLLEPVISEVGVILPEVAPPKIVMTCPNCDWTKEYDDLDKAESGLRMHQRRYCVTSPVSVSNGKHS